MKERMFSASNIFIFLCVFLPILSSYLSPIPGVDFGTFLVLVFTPYMLCAGKWKFHLPLLLVVVLIYTFFCTIYALLGTEFFSTPTSIVTRTGRFLFLIIILIGRGIPSFYEENKFIRFLGKVSIIVAAYAIIQYIAYYFTGIRLPNIFFSAAKPKPTMFVDIIAEYRPASFLLEPSHASYYLTPYLCCTLFKKELKKEKNNMLKSFLITLGILCTTSGQGLIIVAICWGIWLFREFKSFNFRRIIVIAVFGVLLLLNFDFSYTINRMTTTEELNAVDGRMGGYNLISKMDVSELIIGKGFGNYDETVFYASYADIIFCTGFIGLILVVLMFLSFFIKGDFFKRVLILCFLVLMGGSGIYSATFICFFFPLFVSKKQGKCIKILKKSDL